MNVQALFHTYVELEDAEFQRLSGFIESRLGIKMPYAKKQLLEARLQKRLRTHNLDSFTDYVALLFDSNLAASELSSFIDEVTTNKTSFFREAEQFVFLRRYLEEQYSENSTNRINLWSVASSTGEEPYTLAMVCQNHRRQYARFDYQVTASDISMATLRKAVKGIYPMEEIEAIPGPYRSGSLLKGTGSRRGSFRIAPELRARVNFYRLNLMNETYDWKESFDIIFCRNVLIYFDMENQSRIMNRIHRVLRPGGLLFMGPTEGTVATQLPLEKLDSNIYRRPGG